MELSRIIVTGAAGFIGSNFVRMLLERRPKRRICGVDLLTYAGNLENLRDCIANARFEFRRLDICDADALRECFCEPSDAIVNFAAETHVDRSLLGAQAFVRTNVVGVQTLLDLARTHAVKRFLQISTDEVYGSLGETGRFIETTPLAPRSPYSASKAGGDLLVQAAHETFGLPTLITRCSNNYGPYQFPEKLIPLFVTNLLEGKRVPLYGDGLNVRDWIHVLDHCEAILTVLERGEPGRVYNIGGECELPNLEIAHRILTALGRDESAIEPVADRAGHDRRYAIDCSRMKSELGWTPKVRFEQGLANTIQWYQDNKDWWRRVKNQEYRAYYAKQYGQRALAGASA